MGGPTTEVQVLENDDIKEDSEEKTNKEEERGMAPPTANPIHRSSSRPQLDLSGAAIQGNFEERNPTILLPNQSDDISHLALDIGGSLIKLVYFSRHEDRSGDDKRKMSLNERLGVSNVNRRSYPILGGRLHFVKFETTKINECLDFIYSKQLHRGGMDSRCWHSRAPANENAVIKATGGGAYKFTDLFKEKLGVGLDKEDEMDCLVAGANFLLKAIRHEAFTHIEGQKEFVQIDHNDLFPYLLVNIGSGVSIIKVDGDGKFQRVSGTNVGGGTYWGLGKLLTKCKSFDELLELSQRGDNRKIDMLVGDIYGGMEYSKIGLSASTIASSFGKAISENKELEDYMPEDISLSLLRMISYNIGQISYLNALRFGLKRIFFGGFFIRGHAYTMDTISFAVQFWSKSDAQAMFLRHEGFLGALGAFMSYEKHGLDDLMAHQLVERFPMDTDTGHKTLDISIQGGLIFTLCKMISWMEKFVQKGTEITAPVPMAPPGTTGLGGFEVPSSKGDTLRSDASALNVGVLHLFPTLEVFPLLAYPKTYEPNTIDLSDHSELEYWFTVLSEHLPDLVDKAVASEGRTDDAKRRGDAFARAFSAHLARKNKLRLIDLLDHGLLQEVPINLVSEPGEVMGDQRVTQHEAEIETLKVAANEQQQTMRKILQQLAALNGKYDQMASHYRPESSGEALQWYCWLEKIQGAPYWEDFVTAMHSRFGLEDCFGALAKLKQTTSVKEYQSQFERLANRTDGLTDFFLISCFVCGLKEEIRMDVQMFHPTTLNAAIGLARLQEEQLITKCRLARV
ncbi:hypothetical protein HHK36_033288 [Tetracentron sinense]|uniref:pantothenate kinase n=1 Tax=Tetracentron sinense TaxID=13715 RepID=A0A834Y8W8_TETSI|nr:hypothetical protein HHK36_033288 [Tetracentron sinense]